MDMKQKHIVVVGVSADTSKFGHKIFRDLLNAGYNADGVNIGGGKLFEKEIYKSLSQIPVKPHLVLMIIPPEQTEIVTEECIKLGIEEIWMQPGAESQNAIRKAKQAGIKVVSNSCFMIQKGVW